MGGGGVEGMWSGWPVGAGLQVVRLGLSVYFAENVMGVLPLVCKICAKNILY
jgi:hypothetical protein